MIEAAIWNFRRCVDAVAVLDRHDEDVGAADLEVDARRALQGAADDLSTQDFLEPRRHRLRVRGAQMNVVPFEVGHLRLLPFIPLCAFLYTTATASIATSTPGISAPKRAMARAGFLPGKNSA